MWEMLKTISTSHVTAFILGAGVTYFYMHKAMLQKDAQTAVTSLKSDYATFKADVLTLLGKAPVLPTAAAPAPAAVRKVPTP